VAIPYRTGAPTMIKIGKRLCDLIQRFGPVLRAAFPENAALDAALSAAMAACAVLTTELEAVRGKGD